MSNISKINLYCQKFKTNPPFFEILKKEGQDHNPVFIVSCTFEDYTELGEGSSLKLAKEDAATKIVELGSIELKLKNFDDNNSIYSVDSYNAPLADIWKNCNIGKEYTLTLRKKDKNNIQYKNFKVVITHIVDNN